MVDVNTIGLLGVDEIELIGPDEIAFEDEVGGGPPGTIDPYPVLVPTDAQVFSGEWSTATSSVRWDLHDRDGNLLGVLMVDRDVDVTITNDATRSIRRTAAGIIIPPRPLLDVDPLHYYAEDVDPLSMQLRPHWIVHDNGHEFPLGVFIWGDDSEVLWSWGNPRHASFTDLCANLDQPLDHSIGYDVGASVYQALIQQADAEGFGESKRIIENTTVVLAEAIGWVPSRDTRLAVMESLCALAGFLPPYIDNSGRLVCRSAPALASTTPTFVYGLGTVVVPGSAVRSSDILTAPNRYVAVGAVSVFGIPYVGIYDIPDDAPNSFRNTGKYRRKTVAMQGIADQVAIDAAAYAAYASDSSTYSWLSFDTPPDPRHDTWDVVSFDGVNYRQIGWRLATRPGSTMHHDCRGVYAA